MEGEKRKRRTEPALMGWGSAAFFCLYSAFACCRQSRQWGEGWSVNR